MRVAKRSGKRERIMVLMVVIALLLPALPASAYSAAEPSFPHFPRPAGDNGWGIHWVPTLFGQPDATVDFYLDALSRMGIRWVKVLQPDSPKLEHEYLLRRLEEAGIMTILRIYKPYNEPYNHLNTIVGSALPLGVHYYELYNEPNIEGFGGGWRDDEEIDVERLARLWLEAAETVRAAGGLPGVPAPTPGGHYEDKAYLRDFLSVVVAYGGRDTLRGSWIALHNYFLNHPLDYPEDPVNLYSSLLTVEEIARRRLSPEQVEEINLARARSRLPREQGGYYYGSTIHEDSNGFRKFEAYHAIVLDVVGFAMPILSTEGGAVPGTQEDPRYPPVTEEDVADLTAAAYRYMASSAPAYYFVFTPWILANMAGGGADPTWENAAWFHAPSGRAMPVVDSVSRLATELGMTGAHPQGSSGASSPSLAATARVLTTPVPTLSFSGSSAVTPSTPAGASADSDQGWFLVWRDGQVFNCLPVLLSATAPAVRSWRSPLDGRQWGIELRDAAGVRLTSMGHTPSADSPIPQTCVGELAPRTVPTPEPEVVIEERAWDGRLDDLGIEVEEHPFPPGTEYWKIVSARYESKEESGGRHHIYLRLLDENGQLVTGTAIVSWPDGSHVFPVRYKEGNDPYDSYANFPMYGGLASYRVRAAGNSEEISGFGLPDGQHVNFMIEFQRTIVPGRR